MATRPAIRIRRYGRSDFERFDQEAARGSHLCVASTTIGKVDIDCKYNWRKAQWGVLGAEEKPAGIVYIDITFKQPKGYCLEQANVFITLSEDIPSYACSAPHRSSTIARPSDRSLNSDYAVQITERGPHHLTGTPTLRPESKHNMLAPNVGAQGVQVSNFGYESTESKTTIGRWEFRGTVHQPPGEDGLRTLEWELSENPINPEQVHSQAYQTAFAFEHSQHPVFMRVEIKGMLQSWRRQAKHKLLRFASAFSRKDSSTLTELDLTSCVGLERRLDQIAQGLDFAMQMANCAEVPVEMPDPKPAQFHVVERTSPEGPGQDESLKLVEDLAKDSIAETLQRLLQNLRAGSDKTTTCIHAEEATWDANTTDGDTVVAANSESGSVHPHEHESIEQPVLDIVKMPATCILNILKFIAAILQWLATSQRVQQDAGREVASGPVGHGMMDHQST